MSNGTRSNTGRPEFKKLVYQFNEESGYYDKKFAPVGFVKLPNELKLEPPQRKDYKNLGVRFILRSRQVNGKHPFQTGLICAGCPRLFFGDHYHPGESAKNSFCLVRLNDTSSELTIYYFNHFKLYPSKRGQFITEFLQRGML